MDSTQATKALMPWKLKHGPQEIDLILNVSNDSLIDIDTSHEELALCVKTILKYRDTID